MRAFSPGMLWARSRWSRIYSISPPRLRNSSGSVRADIAPVASRRHRATVQPIGRSRLGGSGATNQKTPSWQVGVVLSAAPLTGRGWNERCGPRVHISKEASCPFGSSLFLERLAVAQTQCAATQVSLRFEPASPLQPWLSLATFFSPSASLLLSASVPPGKP